MDPHTSTTRAPEAPPTEPEAKTLLAPCQFDALAVEAHITSLFLRKKLVVNEVALPVHPVQDFVVTWQEPVKQRRKKKKKPKGRRGK